MNFPDFSWISLTFWEFPLDLLRVSLIFRLFPLSFKWFPSIAQQKPFPPPRQGKKKSHAPPPIIYPPLRPRTRQEREAKMVQTQKSKVPGPFYLRNESTLLEIVLNFIFSNNKMNLSIHFEIKSIQRDREMPSVAAQERTHRAAKWWVARSTVRKLGRRQGCTFSSLPAVFLRQKPNLHDLYDICPNPDHFAVH